MGRKAHPQTLAAIYHAFRELPSWSQTELAARVGVKTPALRRWLTELQRAGIPLHREEDHPHVYWSVPPEWFPGGVLFQADDVAELLRQLFRLPRTRAREKLLRRILAAAPREEAHPERELAVVVPDASDAEQSFLFVVEDAVLRRKTLSFRYSSATRGIIEGRSASVQRIAVGPPTRFLAVCHRDGDLKWFRLERVGAARLDDDEPYRPANLERIDALLRESVDGFHQGGTAVACAFVVRDPEARWVVHNLPATMAHEPVPGGLRFSTTTAGVLPLARFVVGLGAAVRVETSELAEIVEELARGALGARLDR
jgi:predicted DNA-binding transcriptional regulator YafY